ncbi:MAG: hypothetical protein VYA30_13395 [Myxococcota bacterium]|nr:hypothetical protein [Myxococcota bacterium]
MKVFSFLLVFLMGLNASLATTVIKLSVDQLATESDLIVRGFVTAKESGWNKVRTRIYTHTTLDISQLIKSKLPQQAKVVIRQIGGEVDGLVQHVSGNAEFSEGEEVIVFLEKHPTEDVMVVMGMAQGKFSVDRSQSPPRVRQKNTHLRKIERRTQPQILNLRPRTIASASTPTLSEFLNQIDRAVGARSNEGGGQ